jgi:hypothetical protein
MTDPMLQLKINFWKGKMKANPKYKKVALEQIAKLNREQQEETKKLFGY